MIQKGLLSLLSYVNQTGILPARRRESVDSKYSHSSLEVVVSSKFEVFTKLSRYVDLHCIVHSYISKTSRFYIGLAVGLPVFSNISIILTHVQTVLSLQGKATSRNWLDR